MLAGFLEPDGGEIRVGGKVISRPGQVVPPERRNMGMIFQSYAVWPHMTVRENVAYGLKMKKVDAAARRARTDAALGATKLSELASAIPPSSPADSSSAWHSPARSRPTRDPAARRSPCRTSTPTCAARCASRSVACTGNSATPPST